jgi:elongation of very long chain fatty acids protein 4
MKNKEPFILKKPLIFYNIIQILLNIYMIQGLINLPIITFNHINIFGLNTKFNDNLKYFTYIHYLSKYLDYCDTWFIILKKKEKQLSFLHVYHHSSVVVIWGYLIHNDVGNGTASFGCFINSIIHLFMYSHYLCTSFGYNNPFKKYITRAQLFQFVICFIHSLVVIGIEDIVPKKYAIIEMLYQTSMIILFSKFYYKSYTPKILNNL